MVLCVISAFERSLNADIGLQESRAVAEKPHDAVVKFNRTTYRNLQRHRAVLHVIGRLSCLAFKRRLRFDLQFTMHIVLYRIGLSPGRKKEIP